MGRFLNLDLSNKLTDYGVKLLYKKLFDKNTEYDQVFYTDVDTIRKLRLYDSSGNYIESYEEEASIYYPDSYDIVYYEGTDYEVVVNIKNYKYLQIKYYYDSLDSNIINRLVLEDDVSKILDIKGQYITEDDENLQNNLTCIICRFIIDREANNINRILNNKWNPIIITDYGNQFLYESLINQRNEKVNFIFTGNGIPNNNPTNYHIVNALDDVRITSIKYYDRNCELHGRKQFSYNISGLNEIGLGFYLTDKPYLKNYVGTMDKNWKYEVFPIDRSININPKTLEYDHPVLSLRLNDLDYACIWYSGKELDPNETTFPNLSFTAIFSINNEYKIFTSEELIDIIEQEPYIPEKTFHCEEVMGFEEIGMTPPLEYKSLVIAYGNGTDSLNYGNVDSDIASVFTNIIYKPVKVTTNSAPITLYTRYITKNHITGGSWFNQTVTYSSKNFINPNSRVYKLECDHPTLGVITDFKEGVDFVCTTTITENNGVVTYQEELRIPAESKLRTLAEDFPNTYDTVGIFTTSYRQYDITFTEGVDYTQSPGSTVGNWWTTWYFLNNIEGGRLYQSYATLYLVYKVLPEGADPDMTPSETATVTIEDGIEVPKYSALSLDSTTGLYRPITVDNGSTVTLLSSLKSKVYIGFDDVRNMPTVGVYGTSTHLTSISGNRTATNYLVPTTLTLSDTSQITSSEAIISYTLRFSNNQSEANILFKTTNIDNFDISNFALEMYNWSDDEGDWHYYTKGTDFTVSNTISTSRTFVQYTCNITAISNDLISSIAQNNSFHFSLTLAQKQNITFTKDIDFSNSYTYRETSRYKYNTTYITAIQESSLDGMVGWFDVYGYTNTISANPVAIAMQAISADGPRSIQVATAGTFNSSKIPNFVPVFIGDFTFTN